MSYLTPYPVDPHQPTDGLPALGLRLDLLQKCVGISTQQAANFDELDDIQPAVRVLDFGNERLWAAEFVRQLLLSHTSIISSLDQKPDQGLVGSIVD